MGYSWQMVPRYHPQISIIDVLASMFSNKKEPELSFMGLEKRRYAGHMFWLNSATSALTVALKALNLPHNSRIAVPVYNCVSVFEAIAAAGLRCIFIDIDPENFSFDMQSLAANKDEISAVIMTHTFGYAGDVHKVKLVLPDRPVIEDCSHAIGSTSLGSPLGSKGAFGVFSFNFNKPVSAGGGGLLVLNEDTYLPAVKNVLDSLNTKRNSVVKVAMKLALKAGLYRPPWYGLMIKCGFLNLQRNGALHSQVNIEYIGRLERNILCRNARRLHNRWEIQRKWAYELSSLLHSPSPLQKFIDVGEDWNGYLLPILVDTPAQRQESLTYFRRHNVDAFVLWSECVQTVRRFGYKSGQCPNFEDIFQRIFFLPCYAEMTKIQRARVIGAVKGWFKFTSNT